jgi:hypothetical protein
MNLAASNLDVEEWARNKSLRMHEYTICSADEIRDAVQDALLRDPRVHSRSSCRSSP